MIKSLTWFLEDTLCHRSARMMKNSRLWQRRWLQEIHGYKNDVNSFG